MTTTSKRSKKKEISEVQSFEIITKHLSLLDKEILNLKNHRKHSILPNTYRFTIDLLSLDFIISLMEDKQIKNVYFNPSIPPPGGTIDSISLRYKIYIVYS
jgi:hypothetical protein